MYFHKPAPIVIRVANRNETEFAARGEVAHLARLSGYSSFMPTADINLLRDGKFEQSGPKGEVEELFVAERDGLLVGLADLMFLDDDWRMVEPMHVRPGYQRQGIGRRLWSKCEEVVRDEKGRGLKVWSLADNKNANAFYHEMGCEIVGEDDTLKIGNNVYRMYAFRKRLA